MLKAPNIFTNHSTSRPREPSGAVFGIVEFTWGRTTPSLKTWRSAGQMENLLLVPFRQPDGAPPVVTAADSLTRAWLPWFTIHSRATVLLLDSTARTDSASGEPLTPPQVRWRSLTASLPTASLEAIASAHSSISATTSAPTTVVPSLLRAAW